MLALFLLALLTTGGPNGPHGASRAQTFPPRKLSSPSGVWTLKLEPHVYNGLRGAEYEITTKGADSKALAAWKGRREYTLRDPILSDRGWLYGWAIVHGPGEDERAQGGTVRFVALDSAGKTIVEDRVVEVPPSYGCMGPVGGPRVLRILPLESADMFAVFVNMTERGNFEEEIWLYDLSTSKKSAFTPHPTVHEKGFLAPSIRIRDVIQVRGEPLVLLHSTRIQFESGKEGRFGYSERWSLFDTSGACVWSFDDIQDPRAKDYVKAQEVERATKNSLRSDLAATFSFTMQRTQETLTKRARRSDAGEWIVEDAIVAKRK